MTWGASCRRADQGPPGHRKGAVLAVGPPQPRDRRAGRGSRGRSDHRYRSIAHRRWSHGRPGDEATRKAQAEIFARGEADRARDAAKQARNASSQQAAALLLDRGIEDARAGEPARGLHLFVQALKTLPADEPSPAALERVIRANLSAWAETVPSLENIWPREAGSGNEAGYGGYGLFSRWRGDRSDRPGRRSSVLPNRYRPAHRRRSRYLTG